MGKVYLTLNEIQKKELEILIFFDKICKDNQLKYTLIGGTLLGAIRHKGFIPWDDDIDVGMPRKDYELLVSKIQNGEINVDPYSIFLDRGKEKKYPFLKLVNKKYKVESKMEIVKFLWIDIMPIDNIESVGDAKLKYKKIKWNLMLFRAYYKMNNINSFIKKICVWCLRIYAKCIGINKIIETITSISKSNMNENTKYMGVISWGLYGIGEIYSSTAFDNLIEVDFEKNKFYSISLWHEYLTGIYNNYMEIPSENNRKTHFIKVYEEGE